MSETTHAPGLIERTVENLVTVTASFLPAMRTRRIHAGPSDALTGFAAYLVAAAVGYLAIYAYGEVGFEAIRGFAGTAALGVAVAAAIGLLLRRGEDWGGLAVGLLWAMVLGVGLSVVTYLAAEVRTLSDWFVFGVLPGIVPAAVLLLARLGPLAGVIVTLAFAAPSLGVALEPLLRNWLAPPSEDTAAYTPPDTEMVYAVQRDLLDGQADLRPGDPERTELFAVLGAGYPYEAVFAREVRAVGAFLESEMGAEGRVLRLVNDDEAPTDHPLLNRVNLRRALERVSEAMDADDILFLFLTSHGDPGALSVSFYPLITRNLTPEDISEALDAAGIGASVIVVSACYSGSFVDALAAPDRLILTAAREDRVSFGCSDQAEWTEWGRAFFVDAWPENNDPRTAARRAAEIVAEREAARELEASEPQIVEGDAIGAVIDRWLETLN